MRVTFHSILLTMIKRTPAELEADIVAYCTHILGPLGVPTVKQQLKPKQPVEVIVGVTIPDVPPETVKDACTTAALRAAWVATWPKNCTGGCREKDIAISADGQTVIFDLVFYSLNLTTPDNLTPAA